MKKVSMLAKLVGLVALGAAAPAAFGLTTNQAYIASYSGRTDIPVPVRVVAPTASAGQVGDRAEVEFLVDATGRPEHVRVLTASNEEFGLSAREAVTEWRFKPAKANGTPVAMKVMLPIVVVRPE